MPTDQLELPEASQSLAISEGRKPLDNVRHEQFARLVAHKYLSAKAAYRSVYQSEEKTCEVNGAELRRKAEITERIEWLTADVTEKSAFTAAKKLRYLESAITTPPSQIDIDSPLCNGSKPGKDGSVQILIPDKLAALKLHAMLSGELVTASSVEVKVAIFNSTLDAPAIDI